MCFATVSSVLGRRRMGIPVRAQADATSGGNTSSWNPVTNIHRLELAPGMECTVPTVMAQKKAD